MADTNPSTPTVSQTLYKRVINLVYSVPKANGKTASKAIKYNNIDSSASIADLYAIGNEIAALTSYTVTSVETIDTSKLLTA